MYWFAMRCVWIFEGRDKISNLSRFVDRSKLIESVFEDLASLFKPVFDRIRKDKLLGTMENPKHISSNSEKTDSNEFRVVRRGN